MILDHVYIENYKNISKQQFSFSNTYSISYNQLDTLEIQPITAYIPNDFFYTHISNVTAIVGENGSGKSTIIEFIISFLCTSSTAWEHKCIITLHNEEEIIIIKHEDLLLNNIHNTGPKVSIFHYKDGKFNGALPPPLEDLEITYFSNQYDNEIYPFQAEELERLKDISTNFLQERVSAYANQRKDFGQKDIEEYHINYNFRAEEVNRQISYLVNTSVGNKIGFKLPDKIVISRQSHNNASIIISFLEKNNINSEKVKSVLTTIENNIDNTPLENKFKYSILCSCIINVLNYFSSNSISSIEYILHKILSNNFNINNNYFQEIPFIRNLDYVEKLTEILSSNEIYKYNFNNEYFEIPIFEFELISNINKTHGSAFYSLIKPIRFDWKFSNSLQKGGLSSGEKARLNLYSRFYESIFNPITNRTKMLILDEPDLGLHPEWQREFFNHFLKYAFPYQMINGKEPKYQIIITSHSPFIAADLPSQNIIYLKKNEYGNCEVLPNLGTENSFASNIHILLSDSYFLKGGFASEFARLKLIKVADSLEAHRNNKFNPNEHWNRLELIQVINLIGEPILKERFQDEFLSVFPINKKRKETNQMYIDRLEEELKIAKSKQ